jgi:hypothetical protein
VKLHIERLVIEGISLDGADAGAMQELLASELRAQLHRYPAQADIFGSGSVGSLDGGVLQLPENVTAQTLARQAARSIHQALGRTLTGGAAHWFQASPPINPSPHR